MAAAISPPARERSGAPGAPWTTGDGGGGGFGIVYLDDDPVSRELLTEVFRARPDVHLLAVATVRAARAAIVALRPALVIVDAWLDVRPTDEFVVDVLGASMLDAPTVAVLSADVNTTTIARYRRLGVDTYLAKPLELARLWAVVDELAERDVHDKKGNGSSARTTTATWN